MFAGWLIAASHPNLNAQARLVVPSVKCAKRDQGVDPSVGMNEASSGAATSAALLIFCQKGKAQRFAALTLNGTEKNYKIKVHPGDKVALDASESSTKGTVTVNDLSSKQKRTLTNAGTGGPKVAYPWIGDVAVFKGSSTRPLGVPSFGTIDFSGAKILNQALGDYPHGALKRFDRYNSTDTIPEIHTGAVSGGSFKTIFKHS